MRRSQSRHGGDRGGVIRILPGVAILAILAIPAARAEEAPPPAAGLTGAEAWSRLVGNTVSGRTPDGPYSEFFASNGSLTIVDGDGKAGGHWALRDGRLCTQVDGEDDEECRDITVAGPAGAFVDAAGSRYPFEILPGNAKGL